MSLAFLEAVICGHTHETQTIYFNCARYCVFALGGVIWTVRDSLDVVEMNLVASSLLGTLI